MTAATYQRRRDLLGTACGGETDDMLASYSARTRDANPLNGPQRLLIFAVPLHQRRHPFQGARKQPPTALLVVATFGIVADADGQAALFGPVEEALDLGGDVEFV